MLLIGVRQNTVGAGGTAGPVVAYLRRKAADDVTVVENAKLAVEAVRADSESPRPFELILMDLQIAISLLERLRQNLPGPLRPPGAKRLAKLRPFD